MDKHYREKILRLRLVNLKSRFAHGTLSIYEVEEMRTLARTIKLVDDIREQYEKMDKEEAKENS